MRFKAYKFYCAPCGRYFNQPFPGIGKYQRATERLRFEVYHQHTEGVSASLSIRAPRNEAAQMPFFSKKEGYATTSCDLRNHRIFDVAKGKSVE